MNPIEVLKEEHTVIKKVLEVCKRQSESIQKTGKFEHEKMASLLDFLENFVDRCHHMKEERCLFPRMEARGISRESKPISFALKDHGKGKEKIRAISRALPQAKKGDISAIMSLKDNLASYVELMQSHIDREDNIIFPVAEHIFTAEDREVLTQAFEKVEREEISEGVHEKYHHLADKLAQE